MANKRKPEHQKKRPESISMSIEEKKIILEKAQKSGRTLSNYMVWAALCKS